MFEAKQTVCTVTVRKLEYANTSPCTYEEYIRDQINLTTRGRPGSRIRSIGNKVSGEKDHGKTIAKTSSAQENKFCLGGRWKGALTRLKAQAMVLPQNFHFRDPQRHLVALTKCRGPTGLPTSANSARRSANLVSRDPHPNPREMWLVS